VKKTLFYLICFAIFVDSVLYGVVVPLLPAFARANNIHPHLLGYIFALYPLTILIFSLPVGFLADKYGGRILMILGMLGMALATVIFAYARSAPMLFLGRFLQGLAAAVTWTVALALICGKFPAQERGGKIGIIGGISAFGLMAGPVVGGVFSEWCGWALPFYICAFFALLTGIGFVFIAIERDKSGDDKAPKPIPWNDARVILSCFAIILGTIGLGVFEPLLPLYVMERFNVGKALVGILFGFISLSYIVAQPFFGGLSDRYGRKPFILAGFAIVALSCLLIILAKSFWSIFIIGGIFGIGLGLLIVPAMALISEAFDSGGSSYGVSASLYNISLAIGLALGPLFGGIAYERIGFAGVLAYYAICMLLGGVIVFNVRIRRS